MENRRTTAFVWFGGLIFTIIFGLVSVTYSSLRDEVALKANRETVILMEQKIDGQLCAQAKTLDEIKMGIRDLRMMHYQTPHTGRR